MNLHSPIRLLILVAAAVPAAMLTGAARPSAAAVPALCRGPDPYLVELVPTARANGASGRVELRFADSPFGATVTPDGHHLYEAKLTTRGLRPQGETLIAWAATPELDQVTRLGVLDENGALEGRITYNKFLVFITAEAGPDVDRWAGPILLRGISPSGRLHTMAGHGPFQSEPCSKWGFGPGSAPNP